MSQTSEHPSPSPGVAEQVQDFYDRYPYPPPVESLEQYRRAWQDQQKRRSDYHLFWPGKPYKEDYSILIAGCGTSQAAKHALRWPKAQVTGVDVSATSVRCTEELKRKYNLTNHQVYQLPIDRVTELRISFDQIVCTGVLHDLAKSRKQCRGPRRDSCNGTHASSSNGSGGMIKWYSTHYGTEPRYSARGSVFTKSIHNF